MSKPYSSIAPIYNYLMRSIDYNSWADYIYSIYEQVDFPRGKVLEIGAGTGKLSGHLLNHFDDLLITDISMEMLNFDKTINANRVVCDMTKLPFSKNFSFIYSCFDSINYLLTKREMEMFFNSAANILNDNGCFTFDVSLENNSLRYQASLNRSGSVNGIKYEQKSYYSQKERIHYNTFKIILDNKIFEETHKQKIYEFFDYFEILENSKLYVENCFNSFTFENANSNSERVQFILKKKKNYDNI